MESWGRVQRLVLCLRTLPLLAPIWWSRSLWLRWRWLWTLAGKFLFVADATTSDASNNGVPGAVSVLAVSNGTLTEVPGSPFLLPASRPVGTDSECFRACYDSDRLSFRVCDLLGERPSDYGEPLCDGFRQITCCLNYSVSSTGALTLVPRRQRWECRRERSLPE